MALRVVNKHHPITPGPQRIYIGRGSPLGNPFPIGPGATRDQVITRYEEWLTAKITAHHPETCAELNKIAHLACVGDVDLVCFCAPAKCHGDIIRDLILKHQPEN